MANARILIVEDNPKNLKLIRDLLQFKGYQTIEADSAEAGIELAREQHPTLILMDIQLPGIDGREAMKVLKADASTQQIPIIALTASAMKGDRERLLAEGFDGYIPKPVDIKAFPEQLESFLSERQ
jgi:two-component system cell cycle response regulator DivK